MAADKNRELFSPASRPSTSLTTVGTISWVLRNQSGAHYPLTSVIELSIRHPRKKTKKTEGVRQRVKKEERSYDPAKSLSLRPGESTTFLIGHFPKVLIPRLVSILFFSVAHFLLHVLSRTFYLSPPLFRFCLISFSPWSRILSFS